MSIWLVAAYAALALGLAWTIASGSSWWWRAPYIVAAPALAFALWLGRPDPAGWPTIAGIPAHATLQWALVDEPNPSTSDPGRIYLWLDVGATAPRAFSLPYSRALHEQVQHALDRVKRGQSIAVARAAARAHGSRRSTAPGEQGSSLHFYAHPPVLLPPKTHP